MRKGAEGVLLWLVLCRLIRQVSQRPDAHWPLHAGCAAHWLVLCGPARHGLTLPGLCVQVALPTGCVPYSVKNSDSDAKKCPQNCVLSNFTDSTDTGAAPRSAAQPVRATMPSFALVAVDQRTCSVLCCGSLLQNYLTKSSFVVRGP